ncbi:MAG: carbonic anhydrase family protein [Proteobacteria bacterium]|jgi:carbonic anhydrase|nr:carbonic anhydrase family protein [Pseudomonadota bacterium]
MKINAVCCDAHRRGFLGGSTALGLLAVGLGAMPSGATAASLSEAQRNAMTPDQVIQKMLEGNARFLSGARKERDFLAEMRSSSAGQFPAAIVLSCVDSRAPVEVICDLGIGDTFNARVAGNAVNDDILGSMEFACAAAGAKAVVLMGHTACGAIKGAIDNVVLGNLTLLLARFKSAIDATVYTGDRTSKNAAFVDAVARTHVQHSVKLVRERSPVLAGLEAKGSIKIIASMYDLASGKVTLV